MILNFLSQSIAELEQQVRDFQEEVLNLCYFCENDHLNLNLVHSVIS